MRRITELKPDKKDLQLLYNLDVNGRMSFSQLGKKAHLSKQVVAYRIERLEKEGFIKGYYPLIDTSKLGYITFRVYLKLKNATPAYKKEIISYLINQPTIWAVVLIAGNWDIALGITVTDIYEYYSVWESFLKQYIKKIADYKTSIYSPIYHYSKSYLINSEDSSPIRIIGGKEKEKFDEIDKKILVALSKNARISAVELSSQVKLTAEGISSRIKQLERNGIIQGYRAMIDVSKLGYQFFKVDIRLNSYDSFNEILKYCHKHPNIYQVDKTIGGETLEIELHVNSLQQMLLIIEDMQQQFSGIIEYFSYLSVLSEEKYNYMRA